MRHNKAGRRLGRTTSHRIAMFRNMVTSFLQHEKITTTDAKAKELRPIAEKMITLGKRGDIHARRQAASYIRDRKVVAKLFDVLGPRFTERPGGYTRIVKLGIRPGDASPLSIIQLVEEELVKKEPKKPVRKAEPKAAKPAKAEEAKAEAAAAVPVPVEPPAPEEKVEESPAEEAPRTEVTDPAEECEAKAD